VVEGRRGGGGEEGERRGEERNEGGGMKEEERKEDKCVVCVTGEGRLFVAHSKNIPQVHPSMQLSEKDPISRFVNMNRR